MSEVTHRFYLYRLSDGEFREIYKTNSRVKREFVGWWIGTKLLFTLSPELLAYADYTIPVHLQNLADATNYKPTIQKD